MLAQRLLRFRLRAEVAIAAAVLVLRGLGWAGDGGWRGCCRPRSAAAGSRRGGYRRHRRRRQMQVRGLGSASPGAGPAGRHARPRNEKTVLLEAGFDELNGISWTKGCYMGQELTARTRYRGLVKRRLVSRGRGDLPAGTPVFAGARNWGDALRPRRIGLALLRLDALGEPLTAAGQTLRVAVPGWARLSGRVSVA